MQRSRAATPQEIFYKRISKNEVTKDTFLTPCNIEMVKKTITVPTNKEVKTKNATKIAMKNKIKATHQLPALSENMFSKKSKNKKQKPVAFTFVEPKTICDYYESFYKIIDGRPLRQQSDIKEYMKNLRDIMLSKADVSYLKEEMLRIDEFITEENVIFKYINNALRKMTSHFFNFLKRDHAKTFKVTTKAKDLNCEVEKIKDLFASYIFKKNGLKSKLEKLEVSYETLSIYKNILYLVSPITWRTTHPHMHIKELIPISDVDSREALDNFRDNYEILCNYGNELYFKQPENLMATFEEIQFHCLNNMTRHVFLKEITDKILNVRKQMKERYEYESNEVKHIMNYFTNYVVFFEEKERLYESMFRKIIQDTFAELFGSYNTTKLFTCVQFVYTKLFDASEDPKDSVKTLMAQIEGLYFKIQLDLDQLDLETVKAAKRELFADDLRSMTAAYKAQRSLKEHIILNNALTVSFEPPRYRNKKINQ